MQGKWKIIGSGAVVTALGAALLLQAPAAASPKSEIAYNRGDALFCANHLEDIILSKAKGSSGNCVYVMQALMVLDNPSIKKSLPVDGDFGTLTDKAVRAREDRIGWRPDGEVSAPTFKNLAGLDTTPDGAAHITGVVTNVSGLPKKPSKPSTADAKQGIGNAPSSGVGGNQAKPSSGFGPKPAEKGLGSAPNLGEASGAITTPNVGNAAGRAVQDLGALLSQNDDNS
jgi:peptidoglycan hydrolase-like protein with peptidoglycan-binding domain